MPYTPHPFFRDPPEGEKLWRYVSLDKFTSLIEREALFFCRADKFADAFEGSLPRGDYEFRPVAQRMASASVGRAWSEEVIQGNVRALSALQFCKRALVIVNCWHHNDVESDAMWNLYLKDNDGVAIQSTCSRLKSSLKRTDYEVNIGMVRYLDYEREVFYDGKEFPHDDYNLTTPYIHKRKYFAFEQEYRAVIQVPESASATSWGDWAEQWKSDELENGKLIDVNLSDLLERVVIAPGASSKVRDKVEQLLQKRGLQVPVLESSMNGLPLF